MKTYPKAWIEALRSGKYQQGKGLLREQDMDGTCYYCCLGVRCDIENSMVKWVDNKFEGNTGVLPISIHEKDGFASNDRQIILPFGGRHGVVESLTTLNDGGLNFSQIADVIECFWEVL